MDIHKVIQSQYLAALEMTKGAIENCPEQIWDAGKDKNRFWHLAYHALFYMHLYLQPTEADFVNWTKARQFRSLGDPPETNGKTDDVPYSKAELLEYVEFCRNQVKEVVPHLDLHAESGFHWLPFSKLELQIYNIRHLMQHTGELLERLWVDAEVEVRWVGMHPVN